MTNAKHSRKNGLKTTQTMVVTVTIIIFVLLHTINVATSNLDNVTITDLVVHKSKVFVSINDFTHSPSTLFELPWLNEQTFTQHPSKLKPFPPLNPTKPAKSFDYEYTPDESHACYALRNVVNMDVDPRGRLWTLDSPRSLACPKKLVVFNVATGVELQRCDLKMASVTGLIVDPVYSVTHGTRAYLLNPNDNQLIVYSLKERRWWRLHVQKPFDVFALFKKDLLYLSSSQRDELFTINLADVRKLSGPLPVEGNDEPYDSLTPRLIGHTLGPITAMGFDSRSVLYYFIARDFAIVRWDTRKPLQAESHDIIKQSKVELPCVTKIFQGPQSTMWAVINSKMGGIDHLLRLKLPLFLMYNHK